MKAKILVFDREGDLSEYLGKHGPIHSLNALHACKRFGAES